jgi:outer membrane receptor protein involved in Fe transport
MKYYGARTPIALAVLSVSAATSVQAQTTVGLTAENSNRRTVVEEIIVTARKREENAQDVPVAIDLVSGNATEKLGISDLSDLSTLLTSVTFDRGATQGDFRPAIRGLQAEQGRTSVGLLIDGIDVTSEALQSAGGGFLANPRLLDVERIEVVKGPQSALYGRSAFGGAINWITRRPDVEEQELRVLVDGNSEQGFEIRGAVGTPIVEEKLAVRLNGFLWDERGSFKNKRSGDYVGGGDGHGLALSMLSIPSDTVNLYGNLSHSEEKYDARAAFVNSGNTTVTFSPEVADIVGKPSQTIFRGELTPEEVNYDLDPLTGRDFPGTTVENSRAAFIADLDFGAVVLTSMTSWVRSESENHEDSDFRSTFVTDDAFASAGQVESNRNSATEQFSQEFRFQSNTDGPLQWTLGALYWDEKVDQEDRGQSVIPLGQITLEDSNGYWSNAAQEIALRDFSRDTEHFSIFAFAEYEITDKFSVSLEGRYAKETIDYAVNHVPDGAAFYPFFVGLQPSDVPGSPVVVTLASITGQDTDQIEEKYFSPRIAISYAYSDDVNIYASVAKAIKPAGNSTGAVVEFDESVSYGRETLHSYEAGIKTTWLDGSLTLNSSVFFQDYSDQQVSSQIFNEDLGVLRGVIENAGNTEILGVEFDAVYRATDNLMLSVGYTYLDAEFTEFASFSTSAARVAEVGCNPVEISGNTTCELDRSGNKPADLPENRAVAQIHYRDALIADWDWFTIGVVSYNGEEYGETANVLVQSAVTNIDLQLGVENDKWRIAAYVENLTDNDDITDASLFVDYANNFAPSAFGFRRDPRIWGVRAGLVF